jgi:hypothetical protein
VTGYDDFGAADLLRDLGEHRRKTRDMDLVRGAHRAQRTPRQGNGEKRDSDSHDAIEQTSPNRLMQLHCI